MKSIYSSFVLSVLLLLMDCSTIYAAAHVLIITPDEYIDQVLPLKSFKDATGRPTILVTLTQVRSNFTGVDDAEKVKRCIAHFVDNDGIRQVLLVGDVDRFPARYQFWRVVLSPTDTQENFTPTDLYYADLFDADGEFDDWDADDNGLYAEVRFQPEGNINQDAVHYAPDVAVGRLPASTPEEVTRYVNKVIRYEIGTDPDDAWYKKAVLNTGSWFQDEPDSYPWANNWSDEVAASLTSAGIAVTKRYWDVANQQPAPGMPQTAINDFNAGFGFANYIGHGAPEGWHCLSLFHSDAGQPTDLLRGLSNTDMWPVVFAASCDTGMFARMVPYNAYIDVNGTEHRGTNNGEIITQSPPPAPANIQEDNDDHGALWGGVVYPFDIACLGEHFLHSYGDPPGSAGAIAYLGERSGGQRYAPDLDKFFFASFGTGQRVLGELWRSMVDQYYVEHNLGDSSTWSFAPSSWIEGHKFTEPMKFILFGDPSLRVGGAFIDGDLCGNVYDYMHEGGPLLSYFRYRITCDVTVPVGQKLTAEPHSSALFGYGLKITALDSDVSKGFLANGTTSAPIGLLASPGSVETNPFRGVKLTGQLRLRNGGSLKLY